MIHNGFKLNTTNIFEINKLVNDYREAVKPLVVDLVADFIAKRACYFLDFYTTVHEELKVAPLDAAIDCFRDDEAQGNSSAYNGFDLIFYPHDDVISGLYFTKQKSLRDLWLKQPGVIEYDVQEILIKDLKAPEMSGFLCHTVSKSQEIPSQEIILNKVPDFGYRVREIALNVMFLIYKEQHKELNEAAAFTEFNIWLTKTDVGNNTLTAKVNELESRLKKEISLEDLTRI
jgi:hypothetical protein